MSDRPYATPMLGPDSPLDDAGRTLIADLHRRERQKGLTLPTDDPLDPSRRRRVEITREEMWSQPEAIQRTLTTERAAIEAVAAALAGQPLERVVMVGCGDSLISMLGVRTLYEHLLGVPCEPVQALDFAYYQHRPVNAQTLVVTLSSSGVTTRVVEALLLARSLGAQTLAMTNTPGSALMQVADHRLLIHAQRKGWPTQASTAAMAMLAQLAFHMARRRARAPGDLNALEAALHATPAQIAVVLQQHDRAVAAIASREAHRDVYLFCGGGPAYACAQFGAAKVKECSPCHAVAIPLEEYHHYNSQKAGDPLVLIAPRGPSTARAADTAEDGRRWGGRVYGVVTEGDPTLDGLTDQSLVLPYVPEMIAPMVYTVPVQMFAYHVAMAKFRIAETVRPE